MAETLYTLQVLIPERAVSEEFAQANPSVASTIEVPGGQTLQQLHAGILAAFGRWEDWLELLFDDNPHDCGSIRYGSRSPFEVIDPFDAGEPVGDAAKTSLSALALEVGQSFGYWFDLWDNWHYEIKVMAMREV